MVLIPAHRNQTDEQSTNGHQTHPSTIVGMELSFEYLMAKNQLKWITIYSEQSMLMSVCLQSIVDELLNQKNGSDPTHLPVTMDLLGSTGWSVLLNDVFLSFRLLRIPSMHHRCPT